MKFVSVKQDKQLVLDGVTFEVTWHDGSISHVLATDAKGNAVRFSVESYNFKVSVPAPPKMVTRFQLTGKVLGMGIDRLFESKYEADEAMSDLMRKLRDDEGSSLSVAEVEVAEEAA
jgi:hypothetical protein